MGLFEGIFIGLLILVIILQVVNRALGSALAVAWCIGAGVYGYLQISAGASITFFGQPVKPYTFLGIMAAMSIYNGWVFVRALKQQRR